MLALPPSLHSANFPTEAGRWSCWLTLRQAAALLTISAKTLRLAAQRGEVEALHPLADGPWIFNRTALASEPVRRLQPYHRTRDTPRDRTPVSKTSIYQWHSQMGQYEADPKPEKRATDKLS